MWWKKLLTGLLVLALTLSLSVFIIGTTLKLTVLKAGFYQEQLDENFYHGMQDILIEQALVSEEKDKDKQLITAGIKTEFLKQELDPNIYKSLRTIKTGKSADYDFSKILEQFTSLSNSSNASVQDIETDSLNNQMIEVHKIYWIFKLAYYLNIILFFILLAGILVLEGVHLFLAHMGSIFVLSGISLYGSNLYIAKILPEYVSEIVFNLGLDPLKNSIVGMVGQALQIPMIIGMIIGVLGIILIILSYFIKDEKDGPF